MDDKIIIYTCITANYDDLVPVIFPDDGIDYICFTDCKRNENLGWEIRTLPGRFKNPAMANRYVKMHPHILFPENSTSVYIDGNILIKRNIKNKILESLNKKPIALYQHPFRSSIYEESDACIEQGLVWAFQARRQVKKYQESNDTIHHNLFECNIIFRKHHDEKVISAMSIWWSEYLSGVKRDQISFPHACATCGLEINNMGISNIRSSNDDFSIRTIHNRSLIDRMLIKIRRITNKVFY